MISNALQMSNAVKVKSNTVKMISNTVKMISNAVKMISNAVKMISNAAKKISNAVKLISNAVEMISNALQMTSSRCSSCTDGAAFSMSATTPALKCSCGANINMLVNLKVMNEICKKMLSSKAQEPTIAIRGETAIHKTFYVSS